VISSYIYPFRQRTQIRSLMCSLSWALTACLPKMTIITRPYPTQTGKPTENICKVLINRFKCTKSVLGSPTRARDTVRAKLT
ncbi:uncharacterized protein C8Q71DRAFT_771370, partial [Rhodofomes roseus]